MIDHLSSYATDYDATIAFYDAVFEPLGYNRCVNMTSHWDTEWPERRICAYGPGQRPIFWISEVKEAKSPRHVAFEAKDNAAVDAFHAAGLAIGAKDNGAPGPRPQYHPGYYGAFLLDPDGNNVEAVKHTHS
jgi:catechol 2,3-dioxygenase-like lactoylglutathione lyase family enzyme